MEKWILNILHQIEFLKKDFLPLIKFSIIGAIGTGINTGLLWTLTDILEIYYLLSSVITIEVTIIIVFILNDQWTFNDRKTTNIRQFIKRIFKSNIWRSGGLGINVSALYIFTEYIGIYYLLSNILGIICAFLLNYFLESRLTWSIE